MWRRHGGAEGLGLDLEVPGPQPRQGLEGRGYGARWGAQARGQGRGDGARDGGHRVGREPVGLQPLRDEVGGVAAVVGEQVGVVVLGGHGKLRLHVQDMYKLT